MSEHREPAAWDVVWRRSRLSLRGRVARLRSKGWHVAQCAVAAGVAWLLAKDLFGHEQPFIAPIAAVVSLGTSYGQRLRRVAEVTLGVAIGVLIADLFVLWLGAGAWQLTVIVALAMSTALLLDAGVAFVTQAAIQSIVVTTLLPDPGQALVRWTDALIGGAVALVAATVVPRAPLRHPRDRAAVAVEKIGQLLRGAARGMRTRDVEGTLDLLADARTTDTLIQELRQAADEGLAVVASSPFRAGHKGHVRQMSELVEPLDLALRNTRVLVRRVAVAAYRGDSVPASYAQTCEELARSTDRIVAEMRADRLAESVQPDLVRLAEVTSSLERTAVLSAEVVLAQLRSIIADLLRITGMGTLEATDAIPPLRPG